MRMDKVILRAALSTLAAIVALMLFMILALSLAFPSTLMTITYDLGMDASSVHYAERAYAQSGEDVYFIAYATEVAIGSDNYEKIESCGEKFIRDDEFAAYCQNRDEEIASKGGYEQYVFGQVCLAKYRLGDKTEAVERAAELIAGRFPQSNALAAVGMTALANGDTATALQVKTKMIEMSTTDFSDTDLEYYGKILLALENGLNG